MSTLQKTTAPFVKLKHRAGKIGWLFWATVAVPTAAAVLYFGVLASDIYVSESKFVVRSPEGNSASSSLGVLLRGTGFAGSTDNQYIVQDFVLSRDAMTGLDGQIDLRELYSRPDISFFDRFDALGLDASYENFYKYYLKKISSQIDSVSSISTLEVRAFTAADAHRLNEQLLEQSEQLVNRLNERGRNDLIRFATEEVARAEQRAKDAALALSAYRNAKGVVNPEQQATMQLQQLTRLQESLLTAKTQLAQLQAFTPQNPQIPAVQNRVQTLQAEVDKQMAEITGGTGSLANKAAQYQRLMLESQFADRLLASTMSTLEQARNEALRKQLYLERVAEPSVPDRAMEPRRLRGILATFVLGLVAWGILSMLLAGVKEHQD